MHMNMRKFMKCLETVLCKVEHFNDTRLKQSDNKMFKKGATVLMKQSSKFSKEDGSL